MEILTEHWLSLGAFFFLLGMILYGHYRGFLRIAVKMSALVISILIVRIAIPHITTFLKDNTQLQHIIQESLIKDSGTVEMQNEGNKISWEQFPAGQRMVIEQLKIPVQMKKALLENNNSEIYQILGVETFFEYIAAYLSDMILKLVGAVILFIVVYVSLRLIIRALDLVSRLPILHGMNQIAGAFLGCILGLLWLWAGCLLVSFCSGMDWAAGVQVQIQKSFWLSFLYHNNFFNWILMGILYPRAF